MKFRILGPIEVVEDGQTVPIASPRQRALLALLLLHANEPITADRIVEELWGDRPPASGAKNVAFHVSRLRHTLGLERGRRDDRSALLTESGGYVLRTDPDAIDASMAERLGREGEALVDEDPAKARERLTEALDLWRGDPMSDLAYESFAQQEIERLNELKLRLLEARIEADLALGRHAEIVAELRDLVAANPYRERLRGHLMLALYRSGRQADALRASQEGRRLLVEELGIDPSPELQALERSILRQDPALVGGRTGTVARNPFKGLRPFEEQDATDFFGREALTARLIDRLADVARGDRLLTLVGPSGCGKSSVVRAGLIPAIRRGAIPGSDEWRIATMVPGSHPFEELAAALRRAEAGTVPAADLRREGGVSDLVARLGSDARLLLVIDQLEELFWRVRDDEVRRDFLRALGTVLSADASGLVVVATLRADALDRALSEPEIAEPVRTGLEVVGRLTRDELNRAIARPAESVGVELEAALAPRIVADVADRPGTLPLLQYALTELYDHGDGRRLTCEAYDALGGVMGAVGRRAEAIYADLEPEEQVAAREVFLRLIDLHEGGAPTIRRVRRDALRSLDDDRGTLEEVLVAFGRGRLLSFDRDPVSGEPTVEPAHEALLSSWSRLAGWIEQARDGLWIRRRLGDAAAEWEGAARDPEYLLTGGRLEVFRDWAASTTLQLSALERSYVAESLAADRRQAEAEAAHQEHERRLERRATRWLRASAGLLAGVAVLAAAFALFVVSRDEAGREQEAIAAGRGLAAAAVGNLGADPELSLLLANEAVIATADRGFVTAEAMDALHWAFQASAAAYPRADTETAVRSAPDGPRAIYLLPIDELVEVAMGATSRSLTTEECLTYLHRSDCAGRTLAHDGPLGIHGDGGIIPLEALATDGLAGTRVRLAAELPEGIDPYLGRFELRTGIAIDVVALGAGDDGTDVDGAADLIVSPRSGWVLELARLGRVVDLSSLVDVGALRDAVGDALVDAWVTDADGPWGSSAPGVYGAPLLASVGGLVWYPKDAFDAAGYKVPRSWPELAELGARIIADGRAPWCLGLEEDPTPGSSGADWLEDLVLFGAGAKAYEDWTARSATFGAPDVATALDRFGSIVFTEGSVLGGHQSAVRTPVSWAGLPLSTEPPGCWLLHGPSTARAAWPPANRRELDVFPLPPFDPGMADAVRGRVFGLAMLSDRPEVRALVEYLLGDEYASEAMRFRGPEGLYALRALDPTALGAGPARAAAVRLAASLEGGTFHLDASDGMPPAVGSRAFPSGMAGYVETGPGQSELEIRRLLAQIDGAWRSPWP